MLFTELPVLFYTYFVWIKDKSKPASPSITRLGNA